MSAADRLRLEPGWRARLAGEFDKDYMRELREFLLAENRAGRRVYPPAKRIFHAFDASPFETTRVVILGQDPYHGRGQAHGLCFSVPPGTPPPPSLRNILKELKDDLGVVAPPDYGCLESWARQGALLLNAVLTVVDGRAGAHAERGWERFTDRAIEVLAAEREHLVFMLWGSYAAKKAAMIDERRHLLLRAPHPSPLSASRGFFGCRHFSAADRWLRDKGLTPIDWRLSAAQSGSA